MTAGFETTQHLIELFLSHLADDPDLWRALRGDRELLGPAIEEQLRWWSPMQALHRRAAEDVELHGVVIPRHATVTTVYGSANRDEREFEEPDEYRLDRDLKRHVAFSAGIHYCAGAPVARHEVMALLNELLDRFARVEHAGAPEPYDEHHEGPRRDDPRLEAAAAALRGVGALIQPDGRTMSADRSVRVRARSSRHQSSSYVWNATQIPVSDRECRECRYREGEREDRDARERGDRAPAPECAADPVAEADEREEVDGWPGTEGEGGDRPELGTDVRQRDLEGEREQDDRGDLGRCRYV